MGRYEDCWEFGMKSFWCEKKVQPSKGEFFEKTAYDLSCFMRGLNHLVPCVTPFQNSPQALFVAT